MVVSNTSFHKKNQNKSLSSKIQFKICEKQILKQAAQKNIFSDRTGCSRCIPYQGHLYRTPQQLLSITPFIYILGALSLCCAFNRQPGFRILVKSDPRNAQLVDSNHPGILFDCLQRPIDTAPKQTGVCVLNRPTFVVVADPDLHPYGRLCIKKEIKQEMKRSPEF